MSDDLEGDQQHTEATGYAHAVWDGAGMRDLIPQVIRVHACEMTAQKMQTVQLALGWLRREMMKCAGEGIRVAEKTMAAIMRRRVTSFLQGPMVW